MKHYASARFWALYRRLPEQVRKSADRKYALLKDNPRHPSLHFKRIEGLWSVRIDLNHRALGFDVSGGIQWFWIGTHSVYDRQL